MTAVSGGSIHVSLPSSVTSALPYRMLQTGRPTEGEITLSTSFLSAQ
jgi:hypothetical protein